MDEDVRNILSKLGLRSCDGVGQKLTKMIANMTDEQVQNKVKTQDVTKIIESVLQISDKPTPHDDQQWEDFHWNVVFTDDVNQGKVLDKDKVIKARMLEMDFFKKMGVFQKVDRGEVNKNKGKIVSTKWVDTDQGHGGYRSRLVGREIKRDKRQDLFSLTPFLEVLKLLAHCAKKQRTYKPKRIGVIDVSRAYFCAKCKRALYIQIPDEDWEPGDEGRVELQLSLYGTRDAAQNWAETDTKYLNRTGFIQGRGSRCNSRHIRRDIKLTVHGDDFLVVADEEQLHWLNKKMQEEYEIKFQVMGPEKPLSQDVKILNGTLRWTQVGIEYEADLEHAGLIVKDTETANMKKRKTPGITQGSTALEKEKEDMSNEEQTNFRSVAARINFLAMDRTDLQLVHPM